MRDGREKREGEGRKGRRGGGGREGGRGGWGREWGVFVFAMLWQFLPFSFLFFVFGGGNEGGNFLHRPLLRIWVMLVPLS
jgi:hypothetical protein